jgi:hypothetical protein
VHISRSFASTGETEVFPAKGVCGLGDDVAAFGSVAGGSGGEGFAIAGNRRVVNRVLRAVGISLSA